MRAGTRARPRAMTRCDSNVDALVSGAPFSDKVMVFRSLFVCCKSNSREHKAVCMQDYKYCKANIYWRTECGNACGSQDLQTLFLYIGESVVYCILRKLSIYDRVSCVHTARSAERTYSTGISAPGDRGQLQLLCSVRKLCEALLCSPYPLRFTASSSPVRPA